MRNRNDEDGIFALTIKFIPKNINRIEKMEIALTILEKKFPQRAKDIKEARKYMEFFR